MLLERNPLDLKLNLVPVAGFEPARPCGHYALNVARLPVSPHRQQAQNYKV